MSTEDQNFEVEDPSEEDAEVQEIIEHGQKAYSIVQKILEGLCTEDKETLKSFLQSVVINDSPYIPDSSEVVETMFDMLCGEN